MFSYTDTADSFKIEKNDKGYFITAYVDESFILEKEVPIKEEKSKLKLYKDVYLVDENGLGYAYDTKLEKLVRIPKGLRDKQISEIQLEAFCMTLSRIPKALLSWRITSCVFK